jgi:hypothetical protein
MKTQFPITFSLITFCDCFNEFELRMKLSLFCCPYWIATAEKMCSPILVLFRNFAGKRAWNGWNKTNTSVLELILAPSTWVEDPIIPKSVSIWIYQSFPTLAVHVCFPSCTSLESSKNLLKIFQWGMNTSFPIYIPFLNNFHFMNTIYLERIKKQKAGCAS